MTEYLRNWKDKSSSFKYVRNKDRHFGYHLLEVLKINVVSNVVQRPILQTLRDSLSGKIKKFSSLLFKKFKFLKQMSLYKQGQNFVTNCLSIVRMWLISHFYCLNTHSNISVLLLTIFKCHESYLHNILELFLKYFFLYFPGRMSVFIFYFVYVTHSKFNSIKLNSIIPWGHQFFYFIFY